MGFPLRTPRVLVSTGTRRRSSKADLDARTREDAEQKTTKECSSPSGGDEQQERVGHEQSRTDVELGRVDEPVLQDGEWQQQQQEEVRGGGADVEEQEEEEQPTSGAEERGHAYV